MVAHSNIDGRLGKRRLASRGVSATWLSRYEDKNEQYGQQDEEKTDH